MHREHPRGSLARWVVLALALVVGPAAIASASPSSHVNPPSRDRHVVWVSRTGAIRPKAELVAAPPAARPATDRPDRTEHGNARDAHGTAAPDPIVVERAGQDRQALPKLHDEVIAQAPASVRPAIDHTSALSAARAPRRAAHAALFHDAHAPPQRA